MNPGDLVRIHPSYIGLDSEPFTGMAEIGQVGVVTEVICQEYRRVKFNTEGMPYVGRVFHVSELVAV